ncbi:hypothetical protein PVAP13_9KG239339 [Panicum virgatum]|uniref:Uncharacterized protein n=1 Tax=Panicum virgatum TaxID=38727 RepID=A0A8T0NSB0_PANVG|nr:hypothetical protein PVAP13_9KG239339 [Panicum virgatum]
MEPSSPSGMSRDGFLVSSAMVAMLSNPPNTPGTPYGRNGVRLPGFAWRNPATMTNAMTSTWTAEATQLTREVPLELSMARAAVTAITATAMGSSSLYPSARVRRPGARHGRLADDALKDEVRGGDEGRDVAELDADVGEGAAGHGDLDGEFGVAEDGEHGGEAGGDVGEHDGGAGVVARLLASEHEDAGADDGAEAEPQTKPSLPER